MSAPEPLSAEEVARRLAGREAELQAKVAAERAAARAAPLPLNGKATAMAAGTLRARLCCRCGERHIALRVCPPEVPCGRCAHEAEKTETERLRRLLALLEE